MRLRSFYVVIFSLIFAKSQRKHECPLVGEWTGTKTVENTQQCGIFLNIETVTLAGCRFHGTDATKKKFLAGRGGIGVSSVEDWKQCPSWLASSGEDGCRGDSQASVRQHSAVCHARRRLAGVSPRLFRRTVPFGFVGGDKTTWGRRLYRSWGRGSGLQSQADGTTTPIKIHSSTLYISTSGCFCYVSPSHFTWWAVLLFKNLFIILFFNVFHPFLFFNVSYRTKCPLG